MQAEEWSRGAGSQGAVAHSQLPQMRVAHCARSWNAYKCVQSARHISGKHTPFRGGWAIVTQIDR